MIEVATLNGPLLDYWVARAEGYGFLAWQNNRVWDHIFASQPIVYAPSVDPQHAVRIIERERITVGPVKGSDHWCAFGKDETQKQFGASFCEAAMRCYVASKFGRSVPDEQQRIINPENAERYFGPPEVAERYFSRPL